MASGWMIRGRRRSLARLAFDTAGNTLVIVAASLMPLTALAGSAVDMARLYVVKVRLQQACDAGALAGRKFMIDTNFDSNAQTQAQNFFSNNFQQGWFSTRNVSFTPQATIDGQISAAATATVPMVVMQAFGQQAVALNVTCQARLEVADVDVMFVLDTTGSMACAASESSCSQAKVAYSTPSGPRYYLQEKSTSKIVALRSAVVDFYKTLISAADPSTHLRFGFVPYTSTVNVGYQLPSNFLISGNYTYQSRHALYKQQATDGTTQTTRNVSSATCNASPGTYNYARTPATGYPATSRRSTGWVSNNGGTCSWIETSYAQVFDKWQYQQESFDVTDYVKGTVVNNPAKIDGTQSRWEGCIEERPTTASTSFDLNALPSDLNIDLAPTSYDTRWRPMWPDVIYYPPNTNPSANTPTAATSGSNGAAPGDGTDPTNSGQAQGYVSCGQQSQRLRTMTEAEVTTYVNGLRTTGGTYHDTGMLWGARFISPTGPFASDTAAWPNRNPPSRNIIFMTDGAMAPNENIYGLYGYEVLDKRVSGGSFSSLTSRHNTRFSTICEQAKAKNITIWVVAYAQTMNSQLQGCASPNKAFYAADDAALKAAFKTIASQIAELRLSK